MYKIANTCRIITRDDKVVIANTKNGMCIRLSNEMFRVLEILCNGVNLSDLKYEDSRDQIWVEDVINKCKNMDILLPEYIDEKLSNSMASVEMTHRCNLRCIHCCIDAQYGMPES